MLSILFISFLLPAVNLGFESPFKGVIDAIKGYLLADDEPVAGDGEAGLEIAFGELIPSGHHVANKVVADTASVQDMDSEQPFDWLRFMGVLYMIGVVLLVARQLLMYFQVSRIIMRSRVVDASRYGCEGVCLRVHGGKEKPFSWFHWIVVGEDDLGDGAREILTHEAAHVKAGHSWDIMLADAVIMLQWFNPLAWIMKNTLKDIHEFEADEAVIASGVNAKQYQLLIIKKAVGARLYSIANSFNHSLTKKRITMMCKEKSKKWSCAKALYILPVAAFVACSLSTSRNAASVGKGNEFISNDASSSTGINVGITSLPSGEEWQYAHVYYTDESSGSKESVCIAYKRGAEGDNVGYFRGTTDEFDNAREGYEPGYFVVPLRNVRLEKDVMTFSIYADDATILQNPVKCAECGIVDAVNNGELWKNNASYLKGKKADFKLHLGPKFVLQNLTNPYVGGERVMGAVEIDYIYECTQEEPSGDDTDIIYQVIEEQPEFPGGMKELM
ncbi:MAG: M56 family metallopeptidase, partial [Bacteroidaceae bacterium]|nr:M56 family metallopeptidase [Bacteroidaceae bacterium]